MGERGGVWSPRSDLRQPLLVFPHLTPEVAYARTLKKPFRRPGCAVEQRRACGNRKGFFHCSSDGAVRNEFTVLSTPYTGYVVTKCRPAWAAYLGR